MRKHKSKRIRALEAQLATADPKTTLKLIKAIDRQEAKEAAEDPVDMLVRIKEMERSDPKITPSETRINTGSVKGKIDDVAPRVWEVPNSLPAPQVKPISKPSAKSEPDLDPFPRPDCFTSREQAWAWQKHHPGEVVQVVINGEGGDIGGLTPEQKMAAFNNLKAGSWSQETGFVTEKTPYEKANEEAREKERIANLPEHEFRKWFRRTHGA